SPKRAFQEAPPPAGTSRGSPPLKKERAACQRPFKRPLIRGSGGRQGGPGLAVAGEAEACKANEHHRPCRRLGNAAGGGERCRDPEKSPNFAGAGRAE